MMVPIRILIPNTRPVLEPQIPPPLAALDEPDPAVPDDVEMTPPEPVGVAPLGILLGDSCPTVNVVGFDTTLAEGSLFFPEGMASTLLAEALNFVGAIEI